MTPAEALARALRRVHEADVPESGSMGPYIELMDEPANLAAAILAALPEGWRLTQDDLDAAWREAEEALPEGWLLGGLTLLADDDPNIPDEWQAYAGRIGEHCRTCNCQPSVGGNGPTPAAALRALTERMKERT